MSKAYAKKTENKLNILALIPARAGSKGIPGKNIMEIAGKPLITYSIEQAIKSFYINRVIVSTDSNQIAKVSKDFGAEVPFIRPSEFSDDLSPDIDVFKHALKWLKKNEDYYPELVVHLRPTGPVRQVAKIDEAIKIIKDNPSADSLRSVALANQTPYKMWKITKKNRMEPLLTKKKKKDLHSLPRQSLPKVFWQNGYVDIVRTKTVLRLNSMTGNEVIPFIHNENLYELDYPEDIPEVEKALLNNNNNNNKDYSVNNIRHSV